MKCPRCDPKMKVDMKARNLSPKDIRNANNNINAAMKKAVVLRYIVYNPCEGVVLPKLKKYRRFTTRNSSINSLI